MQQMKVSNIDHYYDNLGLVVARGLNGEIGSQNKLIWRIKEDLNFFKQITMNSYIIMGRKTYESMPKNLIGRKYIILSRDNTFSTDASKIICRGVEDTLFLVSLYPEENFWVIGGGEIYRQFLPYVSCMHITEIFASKMADVFFPTFSEENFERNDGKVLISEQNISYCHSVLIRKKEK